MTKRTDNDVSTAGLISLADQQWGEGFGAFYVINYLSAVVESLAPGVLLNFETELRNGAKLTPVPERS
jgi:hypothetical protein